jgi:hypothetical protein
LGLVGWVWRSSLLADHRLGVVAGHIMELYPVPATQTVQQMDTTAFTSSGGRVICFSFSLNCIYDYILILENFLQYVLRFACRQRKFRVFYADIFSS